MEAMRSLNPLLVVPQTLRPATETFAVPPAHGAHPLSTGRIVVLPVRILISPLTAFLSLPIFPSPHIYPPKVQCLCHKVKYNADNKQNPIAIHRLRIYPLALIPPGASSTTYTCGAAQGPMLVFMVLNVLGMMLRFLRISMLIW
jgi:hypothetical protein